MADLGYLKKLHELQELAREEAGLTHVNFLEEEFLRLSGLNGGPVLHIRPPKMYRLLGEEKTHYADALRSLGEPAGNVSHIDIFGRADADSPDNRIIIVSDRQIDADRLLERDAYLDKVLERIFTSIPNTIRDFTIREALVGKVSMDVSGCSIDDALMQYFKPASYRMGITIDSPHNSVSRYISFREQLAKLQREAKKTLLDKKSLDGIVSGGLELRQLLGSLSRYNTVNDNTLSVSTDSCIKEIDGSDCYLFFDGKYNILVHFGRLRYDTKDSGFVILDGNDYGQTLGELIRRGIYAASSDFLDRRISTLKEANAGENGSNRIGKLIDELETSQLYLKEVKNPGVIREYISSLPTHLTEFMVYPAYKDPVAYQLLPRLSWNSMLRTYHDTRAFRNDFQEAGETEREDMMQGALSSILFANQQNYDVNNWLYENHKGFLEKNKIKIELK